jgi:cytochrome c biogenesis protein ResB
MSVTSPAKQSTLDREIANAPSPLQLLWRALNSLPVAIFVMVLLALLCAIGTLIPQAHLEPQPPGMSFEQFLIDRYGLQKYTVLHRLGFDHVYFTWYFGLLLAWLACSAVICNIVRFRTTLKLWRTPAVRRGARFFDADRRSVVYQNGDTGVPARGEVMQAPALASVTSQELATAVSGDLKLLGYRIRIEQEDTGEGARATTIYADKGFLKKWGLIALHLAILVLLFGGMYGSAVGVNGNVRMADGEQQTLTIDITQGKFAWLQPVLKLIPSPSYELNQHGFRIDWGKKLVLETELAKNVPPEFHDYFYYYVHDYVSELEAQHKGRTVRREVVVNHPLVIEKLVLYQSGYEQRGYLSVTSAGEGAIATDGAPAARSKEYRLPDPLYGDNTWFGLTADAVVVLDPNSGQWFVPIETSDGYQLQFIPESTPVSQLGFRVAENVKAGDLYRHGKKTGEIGPMSIFSLRDNGSGMEMGSVLIDQDKGFATRVGTQEYQVRMAPKVDNYSIFAYKRDPGSPLLFLGWVMLVAGIALTMYVPFTQVWVRAEAGSLRVLALGRDGGAKGRIRRRLDALLGVSQA